MSYTKKTKIETKVFERNVFVCDSCGFESVAEDKVRSHIMAEHTCDHVELYVELLEEDHSWHCSCESIAGLIMRCRGCDKEIGAARFDGLCDKTLVKMFNLIRSSGIENNL